MDDLSGECLLWITGDDGKATRVAELAESVLLTSSLVGEQGA